MSFSCPLQFNYITLDVHLMYPIKVFNYDTSRVYPNQGYQLSVIIVLLQTGRQIFPANAADNKLARRTAD